MANKKAEAVKLDRERICCQTILAMIPFAGLGQEMLEQQTDYWTTELTVREEKLYNLHHGD